VAVEGLTIGILSWGAHDTLKHTLDTYQHWGLLEQAERKIIFFQQMDMENDLWFADHYGLEWIGAESNIGIAAGYRTMLNTVETPLYLFLENDWAIMSPPVQGIADQLLNASTDINLGFADIVRFRSRYQPGNPLWTRQFEGSELSRPEHLLDCVHWIEHPDLKFPEQIDFNGELYQTTSRFANWTNNPHMASTSWLKSEIAPRIGDRDIELDLQEWWQEQDFIVAQGEGIFTHYRI
jgi:hypothetical protein